MFHDLFYQLQFVGGSKLDETKFLLHSHVADVRSGRTPCASLLQVLRASRGELF